VWRHEAVEVQRVGTLIGVGMANLGGMLRDLFELP
jgi:hypothetical protein